MSGAARQRGNVGAARGAGAVSGPEHAGLVDRADEPAEYRGWARHWVWPAVMMLGGTAGIAVSGVDLWRAAALSAGIAIVLWSIIATMAVPDVSWHDDVPGRHYHPSSSWEVAGLDAARESGEAFDRYLRPRLWPLAVRLLERRGVDPGSERAREIVGPGNYALLVGEDIDPRHRAGAVSTLCHAVARLAVSPLPEGRPPVESPSLAGLAGPARADGAVQPGSHTPQQRMTP